MLQKLKEYKEIIAIMVFFAGGFMWLNKQYPTKAELHETNHQLLTEIQHLQCLLKKYMQLTQLQIRSHDLEKQIDDLKSRFPAKLPSSETHGNLHLSPAMKLELDQMKSQLTHKVDDLRATTMAMETLRDELARDVCKEDIP